MSEVTEAAPVETAAPQPVVEAVAKASPQERGEGGQFAAKEKPLTVADSIKEAHEFIRGTVKKTLDPASAKVKDQPAKTDPASKEASATAKAKPEPSSKDATRIEPKKLDKARKALELEGWSEEEIADLSEERTLSIGTKYQEKHAKADREKREAAEAAKKAPKPDPAKRSATDSSTASETDDDLSEYVKAAEEHFKGFEAETEEGTKAFRRAQAKFVKEGVDRATARLQAKFDEQLEHLTRGVRGETALNRALDRIAIDIPQVDDTDVRQKLTNRIAALASDPDTAEEIRTDIRSVIRREAAALGLKDEKAEREKAAREELRAAKDGGQPISGSHTAPTKEPEGMEIFAQASRDALRKARGG